MATNPNYNLPKALPRFVEGDRLNSGKALQELTNLVGSVQDNVVAGAGGTQANAININSAIVYVATVASANDSLLLPKAYGGLRVSIYNSTVTSCQIFGNGIDTINGVAFGTGFALAGGGKVELFCVRAAQGGNAGVWFTNLSA